MRVPIQPSTANPNTTTTPSVIQRRRMSPPPRIRAARWVALERVIVVCSAVRNSRDRHIDVIPDEALAALQRCPWRGNIRELSNLIERAVTLSSGPRLAVPIDELDHAESSPARKHGGVTLA